MIELRSVGVRRGDRRIFEDLDLTVSDPGLYAVCGPMASGKSVLGRLVCGLQRPSSGQVLVDQQKIYGLIPWRLIPSWYCDASQLNPADETVDNYARTLVYDAGGDQRPLREVLPRLERALDIGRMYPLSLLSAGQLCYLQLVLSGVMPLRVCVFDGQADVLGPVALSSALELAQELRTNHDAFVFLMARGEEVADAGGLAGLLQLRAGNPASVAWGGLEEDDEPVLSLSAARRLRIKLDSGGGVYPSGQTYTVLAVEAKSLLIERQGTIGAVLEELAANGISFGGIERE